ncbi:MAG: HAMP domain-containing sensor histidine kinase [Patescibacteria group bacterium]
MQSVTRFIRTTTARLAASYLLIIMAMSIGFSFVFYQTSSHELGRQLPPPSVFVKRTDSGDSTITLSGSATAGSGSGAGVAGSTVTAPTDDVVSVGEIRTDSRYNKFFQNRIDEARDELLGKLVLLNLLALILGSGLSYYLARRTLRPIETAMETQHRFVTDASHELRTPLTAILTTNEVALRSADLKLPEAKDLIKSNVEEVKKLKDLTDGLLNLAKQNGSGLLIKPVSLQQVVGEAMNSVIASAQAKKISVDDNVPNIKVEGDKEALVQAVVILLDNAIKYSDNKTTIHLEGHKKDGRGFLAVRDEGVGISPVDLPHIFDRFYRADKSRTNSMADGYGIGLAIAQKIIDQHHGRIEADSTLGKGSVFVIELPLA